MDDITIRDYHYKCCNDNVYNDFKFDQMSVANGKEISAMLSNTQVVPFPLMLLG